MLQPKHGFYHWDEALNMIWSNIQFYSSLFSIHLYWYKFIWHNFLWHCTFPQCVAVLRALGPCAPAGRLLPRSETGPPCQPHDPSAPLAAATDTSKQVESQGQELDLHLEAAWYNEDVSKHVHVSPWRSCPAPGPAWRISPAWAQSGADRSGLCSWTLDLSASPHCSSPPPAPTPSASACPDGDDRRSTSLGGSETKTLVALDFHSILHTSKDSHENLGEIYDKGDLCAEFVLSEA